MSRLRDRVRQRKAEHAYVKMFRAEAWSNQNGKCAYCWALIPRDKATADHFEPRANGGTTTRANIRAVCKPCNKLKGAHSFSAFRQLIKNPPTNAGKAIVWAHVRRRIWLRTERAEKRILKLVGLP